jgi:hypothetical protein
MREDIESALPPEFDIERLIVFAQYLLLHAADGRETIDQEDVFEKYTEVRGQISYDFPLSEHFDRNHAFAEAFNALTTSKSLPPKLAEGFFLLKSNVVDADRLEPALEDVIADPEKFVSAATVIDPEEIGQGYRIGTSRTNASKSVQKFLEQIKEYALELDSLNVTTDLDDFVEKIHSVSKWFDPDQNVEEVKEQYETLYKALGKFEIGNNAAYNRWENGKNILENQDGELQFDEFSNDITYFQEIINRTEGGTDSEPVTGLELISILHEYQDSLETRVEWKLYEHINEMIEVAETVKLPEGGDFKKKLLNSEEVDEFSRQREALAEKVGGDW